MPGCAKGLCQGLVCTYSVPGLYLPWPSAQPVVFLHHLCLRVRGCAELVQQQENTDLCTCRAAMQGLLVAVCVARVVLS